MTFKSIWRPDQKPARKPKRSVFPGNIFLILMEVIKLNNNDLWVSTNIQVFVQMNHLLQFWITFKLDAAYKFLRRNNYIDWRWTKFVRFALDKQDLISFDLATLLSLTVRSEERDLSLIAKRESSEKSCSIFSKYPLGFPLVCGTFSLMEATSFGWFGKNI